MYTVLRVQSNMIPAHRKIAHCSLIKILLDKNMFFRVFLPLLLLTAVVYTTISYDLWYELGKNQDPVSSNVRRFRSNQSISNINNIHTDLGIELFDQRNPKIDKKTKSVSLH